MTDINLHSLGEEYQGLRRNSLGENEKERKYEVMNTIAEQLGLPGTPAAEIISTLGKPDEMKPSLGQDVGATLMPGPVIGGGGVSSSEAQANNPLSSYYFVYYCKSKNDFYYFKVDAVKETVITSDWQHET